LWLIEPDVFQIPQHHKHSTLAATGTGIKFMTAEEIKTIVLEELRLEPNLKNVRGYDLSNWVVEPIRRDYKDAPYHINRNTLWTVFEERKDGKGYYIYFDDQSG
jgi:hypothetical protein